MRASAPVSPPPSPAQRLVLRLTHPPTRPLLQLTVYYVALAVLASVIAWYVPFLRQVVVGLPAASASDAQNLREVLTLPVAGRQPFIAFDLNMAAVMAGTLLITVPFSWGYMSVREHVGYEQSVVQTLVVLPVVVAAIMMIVQFSLALAFALGGVAAAVRFRNTLKDVADAVYVFLAIGIGIAAGTGALSAALVMSAFFTYTAVLLWRCNFGECVITRQAREAVLAEAARKAARKATRKAGRAQVHKAEGTGEREADHQEPRSGRRRDDSAERRRGELTVEVADAATRERVETLLDAHTRGWRLRHSESNGAGTYVLRYDLRLKRSIPLARVLATVREELGRTPPAEPIRPRDPLAA